MSYTINFTDSQNKQPITVNDSTVNTDTSLSIPGRNQRGYAVTIAEDFLHLLENFSNSSSPSNPVQGQLWYDSTIGIDNLKVYDGTSWKPAGSVNKGETAPIAKTEGDLWVDTVNQQLFLYNGASWVLVGPTFSSGLKSGVVAESILDSGTTPGSHTILKTYVDDQVVTIYSASSFVPKVAIDGFKAINAGINISTNISNTKYWGVAEKAENLIIGTSVVAASNFLRKDVSNITNYPISIKTDQGIATGESGQLQISVDSGKIGNIYHATSNSAFDIRIKDSTGSTVTLIRADSTGNVGIGPNNFTPGATLDVKGNSTFSDIVSITSTATYGDINGSALQISGGATIQKDLYVQGGTTFNSVINVGNSSGITDIFLPSIDNLFNIGNSSKRFASIHSANFVGNVTGSVTGNVTGSVTGSATNLKSSTTFNMSGDVTSAGFSYDGSIDPSTGLAVKTFNTTISVDFIDSKVELPNPPQGSDELLIYRPGTGQLGKMLRSNFFTNTALIPIGTILPFAGTTPPAGYLFCDGSEKSRVDYPDLFQVLLYTYGDPLSLSGIATFRLPDLRGKFALGRNTMNNSDTVESRLGPIDSNTQAPSGTIQTSASTLGNINGVENVTLGISNIPNHKHTFLGDQGGEYYTINPSPTTIPPTDTHSILGNGPNIPGQAAYNSQTGDMVGGIKDVHGNPNPNPIEIMNPYVTINYIIFTGKFV